MDDEVRVGGVLVEVRRPRGVVRAVRDRLGLAVIPVVVTDIEDYTSLTGEPITLKPNNTAPKDTVLVNP
ncbi:hypothetical protein [Natrinema gelatinilyticum]|uniref:hypothetical protein n=1 Tax=Natrinema gelatinilyticum TaxID=2961571 RepID=UPI0020C5ADA1|nr:hypothetical protein [Natrinema gelatinilyticum]